MPRVVKPKKYKDVTITTSKGRKIYRYEEVGPGKFEFVGEVAPDDTGKPTVRIVPPQKQGVEGAFRAPARRSSCIARPGGWRGTSPPGARGVAVPAVPLVDSSERLANRRENDGVLADVVAAADRVNADLLRRAFATNPSRPWTKRPLPSRMISAKCTAVPEEVLLEAVMTLDDLDVEPLAPEPSVASRVNLKSRFTTRLRFGRRVPPFGARRPRSRLSERPCGRWSR